MPNLKQLYKDDTLAWAENQTTALREAAQGGSNQALDWENLAEEIEDLDKSVLRGVHSHLRNIIEHLIKLEHSPAVLPRQDWFDSIQNARVEVEVLLEESPSLRPRLAEIIQHEIPRAAKLALGKLRARHELRPPLETALRAKSYLDLFAFSEQQILGDWFPPKPEHPRRDDPQRDEPRRDE